MGLDVRPRSGGCCGLAGSWGFEQGNRALHLAEVMHLARHRTAGGSGDGRPEQHTLARPKPPARRRAARAAALAAAVGAAALAVRRKSA